MYWTEAWHHIRDNVNAKIKHPENKGYLYFCRTTGMIYNGDGDGYEPEIWHKVAYRSYNEGWEIYIETEPKKYKQKKVFIHELSETMNELVSDGFEIFGVYVRDMNTMEIVYHG